VLQKPWVDPLSRPAEIRVSLWAYNRDTAQKLGVNRTDWFLTNNTLQKANLQEFKTAVKIPELR
jgi:hypothetical protein